MQVTLDMIRVSGVRSVTMRSVADALGVRAASLYYHVEDKGALLDLILVEVGTQLGPAVIEEYRTVETLDEWIDVTRRTTGSFELEVVGRQSTPNHLGVERNEDDVRCFVHWFTLPAARSRSGGLPGYGPWPVSVESVSTVWVAVCRRLVIGRVGRGGPCRLGMPSAR
jgi:AcrR family transcriptional regulator